MTTSTRLYNLDTDKEVWIKDRSMGACWAAITDIHGVDHVSAQWVQVEPFKPGQPTGLATNPKALPRPMPANSAYDDYMVVARKHARTIARYAITEYTRDPVDEEK